MSDLKKPTPQSSFNPRATLPASTRYPEKPTVETAQIPAPLAAMLAEIQEGIKSGFARTNQNIDVLNHSFDGLQDRVARLEERDAKSRTGPQRSYSGQINAVTGKMEHISQNDLSQDRAIANILAEVAAVKEAQKAAAAEREETAKKVADVHDAVVSAGSRLALFWASPPVKILRAIATGAIVTYAAAKGIQIGK